MGKVFSLNNYRHAISLSKDKVLEKRENLIISEIDTQAKLDDHIRLYVPKEVENKDKKVTG